MIYSTKIFLLFIILFNFVFSDFFYTEENFSIHNFFFLYFIIIIYLNYKITNKKVYPKFDFDVIFKFWSIMFKTPNFFFNYYFNIFKKIYLYLFHFKFRYLKSTIKLIYKKYFSNIFVIWKPLFKKTSYFGYYRSNRSKWIK